MKIKWKTMLCILLIISLYITALYAIFGRDKFGSNKGNYVKSKDKKELALEHAKNLSDLYMYNEAIDVLTNTKRLGKEGEELLEKCKTEKSRLVKYDGQIYHIFFHSLIVYPSLAFDGDYKEEGYNMWMTTADEFKKMLPLLYENNFILIDMQSLITKNKDGTITKNDIYLPQGKKPLIISIDDVNYYGYMKGDGFADKLVLDKNNEVKTLVTTPEGEETITNDGDVIPILDEFVKKNPKFSYRGAKGVIAVTGYEGALGYRINPESETKESDFKECQKIAKRLRDTGWIFACHSYTHNDYFRNLTATMQNVKYDTDKWKNVIEPAIGKTDIYISPFGYMFGEKDERFLYVINSDFPMYCPVSTYMTTTYTDKYLIQGRFNLDGYTLTKHKNLVAKNFFDPDAVLDKRRPPMR